MSINQSKNRTEHQPINEWKTQSGEIVVDRYQSHLHGQVKALLSEVLSKIETKQKPFLKETIDLGRIVGKSICVETNAEDEIIHAQRKGRNGPTRFVKNREAEPCSNVTVVLKKAQEFRKYILVTAFFGDSPEPEPWDRNATPQSEKFWSTHALLWEEN